MKKTTARILATVASLLLLTSCIGTGYDAQRYNDDRLHFQLCQRMAQGWFGGLAFTVQDQRDVESMLTTWAGRLDSDAAVLGLGVTK